MDRSSWGTIIFFVGVILDFILTTIAIRRAAAGDTTVPLLRFLNVHVSTTNRLLFGILLYVATEILAEHNPVLADTIRFSYGIGIAALGIWNLFLHHDWMTWRPG